MPESPLALQSPPGPWPRHSRSQMPVFQEQELHPVPVCLPEGPKHPEVGLGQWSMTRTSRAHSSRDSSP